MNDPWDVKSVRQPGQYVSCMKINGVPLLPPVLSKECRKEMQYYKLLAKEVEKRISVLQPYIADSDSESEDKTDAPELPENEEHYALSQEGMQDGFNGTIDKMSAHTPKSFEKSLTEPPNYSTKIYNSVTSNVLVESIGTIAKNNSPKYILDLSLKINESCKSHSKTAKKTPCIDRPERDYNCVRKISKKTEKELLTEIETPNKQNREVVNCSLSYKDGLFDPISDFMMSQDGPSSLSSKSFTGSLNDLHSESIKDGHAPLIRQRSYTLLKPSPQLLAHLEVQSISTGIEMHSISMSESLSNLSTPKKRRSWDLETAKVKWSSMAMELKQKNVNGVNGNQIAKPMPKKSPQITPPPKARSVIVDRSRRGSVTPKALPKSDPLPKTRKVPGPISVPTNRAVTKEPTSPTIKEVVSLSHSEVPALVSECADPATRIRELYEKIQKQQSIQMASLVEKQKQEQLHLHKVFEEQNNLLFKQLKTICPKSPIEVQEAWGDKHQDGERGPVSLSQLINHKSPDQSILHSPVSTTLTETNNYINRCDNVLKKSKDITGGIKKQQTKSRSQNGTKIQSPRTQPEGSRTRTHSPSQRSTLASRRLNYDTSASSDREYDPILTDRTNDTMADVNVTFPSDSDGYNYNNSNIMNHLCGKEMKISLGNSGHTSSGMHSMFTHTDSAIRTMERTIQNSINNTTARPTKSLMSSPPTAKQRAAATKIVAVAKGYLVRRLMRTDRVQATVQTIKDALLCALQLHQDREGIRGADVDLHRRLIQQITAACYSLHDTFVTSSPGDRCAMISADRGRRRSLANRQPPKSFRQTDIMSQSHSGAFPARTKRSPSSAMTQSNYETYSGDKSSTLSRQHLPSPRRRPWR